MFNKKTVHYDVIIGEKATITGDITTEGSVCIDGKILGNIDTLGSIILSNNASMEGNIKAQSAEIYGVCKGDIETSGAITIHADASLHGDAKCESIQTLPGCRFIGNLNVTPSETVSASKQSRTLNRFGRNREERERRDEHPEHGSRRNEVSKLSGEPKPQDNTKKYSRS